MNSSTIDTSAILISLQFSQFSLLSLSLCSALAQRLFAEKDHTKKSPTHPETQKQAEIAFGSYLESQVFSH
jgi:hypothetical protein